MSNNKVEQENADENANASLNPKQIKLNQIYEQVVPDEALRNIVTQNIDARTQKCTEKIATEIGYLEGNIEEVSDIKPLIRKWRGEFIKDEIKNYAKTHLYVTDTTMGKKDLDYNLKVLDNNIDAMGTTNGFERIEKQLNLSDKLLKKNSMIGALKPTKDLEPFIAKKETYEEKKKHQDEEWQKHMDEANQLMDKLNQEKKMRKDKIREIRNKRKQNREKSQAERLAKQEEEEEKKNKEIEDRHKAIQDKIEQMKDQRKKNIDIMNENTKKIERPKYVTTIQHNYEEKVLMPSLEMKKKTLASIRDLHKPIRIDEIREYSKKMDEIVEKQKQKLYKERTQFYKNHTDNYHYKEYETNFIQAIKEQDMHEKEEADRREIEKRELTEKMRSYGEMVKEMHRPTVSKKKQLEMQLLKQNLKHSSSRKLAKNNLSTHNLHRRKSVESLLSGPRQGNQTDVDDNKAMTVKRRKLIWKENPMVPKPKPKKPVEVSDWLLDRRAKRQEQEKDYKPNPINDWK